MRSVALGACIALAACSGADEGPRSASAAASSATFQNPVVAEDCPDPSVLETREIGRRVFYLVCTGGGFRVHRSFDLVGWEDTGASIFPSERAPWAANGARNWAPEIHRLGERSFVAYYTAADAGDRLAIGVAYAESPLGPWTDDGAPLVRHAIGVIDPTFFHDPNGASYLYWKVDGNQRGEPTPIMVRALSDDGRSFAAGSRAREVLRNDRDWEGPVVEAPWLTAHDGEYFLFYSANAYDARYLTGVARSRSPLGPFVKNPEPILKSNDRWLGPGHGAIVHTANDEDWFVHHAWNGTAGEADYDTGRFVLLDRVHWSRGKTGTWPWFENDASAPSWQRRPSL